MSKPDAPPHGASVQLRRSAPAITRAAAARSTFPRNNRCSGGRPCATAQHPKPETPYQRAGQVWDERIGSARVQAKNWRLAFFGMLGLSGGLVGALVWESARGTVTPWVVQVDKLGQAQAVAPAVADYRPTDPQIAWHLARFIEEVRGIPADPVVLRQNWLEAYNYVSDKGALALNDYARTTDPFSNIGKTQVSVDVSSVIRASADSFRIAWVERRYVDDALAATERWSAIVTVIVQIPTDADRVKKNRFRRRYHCTQLPLPHRG